VRSRSASARMRCEVSAPCARSVRAEAQRQAQVLRGQGDADATRIFAEAFKRDPQFYSFYRSLQAYRQAIGEGTTLVLTPESEFFRFFRDMQGTSAPAAPPVRR